MERTLYVDMDGTIARFHDEPGYLERMSEKDFFFKLKAFDYAVEGIKRLINSRTIKIKVLSTTQGETCSIDKTRWLGLHIPELTEGNIILVPAGQDKTDFIADKGNAVLLDDYNKNLEVARKEGLLCIKAVNNINDKGRVGEKWGGLRVDVCSKDFYEQLISALKL